MQRVIVVFLLIFLVIPGRSFAQGDKKSLQNIPDAIMGDFKDDYDETYSINKKWWIQKPGIKYRLLKYDSTGHYFIAKNDSKNPFDADLYARIDIMYFSGMEPWTWGFCLTAYKAKTFEEAEATAAADRNNPKKGCNGYPFSRMKRN